METGEKAKPGTGTDLVVTLLVDIVATTILYYVLRWLGVSVFASLVIGAVVPLLSMIVGIVRKRRINGVSAVILVFLLLSAGVSLITGSPRFLLAKDGWLTGVHAAIFFLSLLFERPLTFLFARPLLEGRRVYDARYRQWRRPAPFSWDQLWEESPVFRRMWKASTVLWGAGTLIDAVLRVTIAYTLPLDAVPAVSAALWPVTFVVLQIIVNVYFARSGFFRILIAGPNTYRQAQLT